MRHYATTALFALSAPVMAPADARRNIGQNRGKPRLWIEGKVLVDAGLDHGARWDLVPHEDGKGFDVVENADGKRKIAGKPGRPIIDITGKTLGAVGEAQSVTISQIEAGLSVRAEEA